MYTPNRAPPSIQSSISAFSGAVGGNVDLQLLRDIEETVDVLLAAQRAFEGHLVMACDLEAKIRGLQVMPGALIDEPGTLEAGIREALAQSEALLVHLNKKKAAIDKDGRLPADHRGDLHDAYDQTIDALALLVDAVEGVLAALISHDLAAESRDGKEYSDIRELHADLSN